MINGERQHDFNQPLDDLVGLAAEIGRGRADDRACRAPDEGRAKADHQRGARAIDQA